MFIIILSSSTHAVDHIDWKACAKEMNNLPCSGSDKAVWVCLKKNNKKLSQQCLVTQRIGNSLFQK